jgi:hypothetical protein
LETGDFETEESNQKKNIKTVSQTKLSTQTGSTNAKPTTTRIIRQWKLDERRALQKINSKFWQVSVGGLWPFFSQG